MIIGGRRASLLLFAGDLVAFVISLYITLWLRYLAIPDAALLIPYLVPFTFLFALWILVFYSAGLYSKQLALFPSRLSDALFKTQFANILFAALFFFLIPSFGITPKTILVMYLIISLILIFIWRLALYPRVSLWRSRERAVLLAHGPEADELFNEVNGNPRYDIEFSRDERARAGILVVDKATADTAFINNFVSAGKQVVAFEDMYEEVFDRVPLSQLGYAWFRENVASVDPLSYAIVKRCIDIVGGIVMGFVVAVLAPFVWVASRIEGPGPLFIAQERLGRYGARIIAYKFRSMTKNLAASGEWMHEGENRVTKVGSFLRGTSLDEFPQFVNILKGELSLIGPRSDILGLGRRLAEALPYYEARYMVAPGITGWAQINQQYEPGNVSPQSIEETKVRLAYDFYYLKHRSLGLDIIIALKTLKRMFFRLSSW
ncbi:MAG: sugar transferase [Candidatus Paceibacterota bacterium]|jgi:lipopolysaccharide/colanic/teichoic acid biosynthesis glycosyltransferase